MSDVNITINGGNIQILPNATEAVQNFYINQSAEPTCCNPVPATNHNADADTSSPSATGQCADAGKLSLYINKENLPDYLARLRECDTATEFAKVVIAMYTQETSLSKEEIVKERFISLLLPFAPNLTEGKSIANLRARINDALAALPRQNRSKL